MIEVAFCRSAKLRKASSGFSMTSCSWSRKPMNGKNIHLEQAFYHMTIHFMEMIYWNKQINHRGDTTTKLVIYIQIQIQIQIQYCNNNNNNSSKNNNNDDNNSKDKCTTTSRHRKEPQALPLQHEDHPSGTPEPSTSGLQYLTHPLCDPCAAQPGCMGRMVAVGYQHQGSGHGSYTQNGCFSIL